MTLYLNFRAQAVGGAVTGAQPCEGDAATELQPISTVALLARTAGKRVLFGVHGFNVSRDEGRRALARLEPSLNLASSDIFIGVLWPGDFWIPVINYPFEGGVAMDCGRRLADFCNRSLTNAANISFFSHSLGARLVLETVVHLAGQTKEICLTAAAINRDCLAAEYAAAVRKAGTVSILASRSDLVLKLAFPIGDPISDILHNDHTPFQPALGYNGPRPVGKVAAPWQIPDDAGYDHGDYLPSSAPTAPAKRGAKWLKTIQFMARAFRGEVQSWP